jgi:hypothetical protein
VRGGVCIAYAAWNTASIRSAESKAANAAILPFIGEDNQDSLEARYSLSFQFCSTAFRTHNNSR